MKLTNSWKSASIRGEKRKGNGSVLQCSHCDQLNEWLGQLVCCDAACDSYHNDHKHCPLGLQRL